jgi:hypothetical protein
MKGLKVAAMILAALTIQSRAASAQGTWTPVGTPFPPTDGAQASCVALGEDGEVEDDEQEIPCYPSPGNPTQLVAPFGATDPLLLTDGTVMVRRGATAEWWRYRPDINGDYANGTWSFMASMAGTPAATPPPYIPLY